MQSWMGKHIKADILYSKAGTAQQIWVSGEDGSILVDAGDGLLRDIEFADFDVNQIKGVIFTHGHFDHMGGLYSLLGYMRMVGREELLLIFAPEGCTEVFSMVDNFKKSYGESMPYEITCKKTKPNEEFQLAGMTVKAYPMVHYGGIEGHELLDQVPAMGYRFSYKGETIAISGDTGICPSLSELVKGADLAILEATFKDSKSVDDEILAKVHLSEDVAEEVGKLAKYLILVHKGPRKKTEE